MQETSSSTLEKIQQAALSKFLDKGFRGSFLHQIVKSAGVTTGAFCEYFPSEEALFVSIVEPHVKALMSRFMDAQLSFAGLPEKERVEHVGVESKSYLRWMVDYICGYKESVKLLVCGATGTGHEDFIHNVVEVEVESTMQYVETLRALGHEGLELSCSLCHIIVNDMLGSVFEIVIHDIPKEETKHDVEQLREFYTAGWLRLFPI